MKSKSAKRILIVSSLVVLCLTAATGVFTYRKAQIRARYAAWRQEGLAATEAGRHREAVDRLGLYLSRYPMDTQAMAAYVQVRPLVKSPKSQHLRDTIVVLRRLLGAAPDRVDQRRQLSSLYLEAGYHSEAVDTADAVLQAAPDDQEALRVKSTGLLKLRRFADSLTVARRLNERFPRDLEGQILTLAVLRASGEAGEKITAEADSLVARAGAVEPGSSVTAEQALVRGYGQILAGNDAAGRTELKTAAEAFDPANKTLTRILVSQLDAAGLFVEAVAVLDRGWRTTSDPAVREKLVQRYTEGGQPAEVLRVLDGLDPADVVASSDLLGLRAVALSQLGRAEESAGVLDRLSARSGDRVAAAWVAVLQQGDSTVEQKELRRVADLCYAALEADPDNPYLRFQLGNARARLGEGELALEEWKRASAVSRTWSAPVQRSADYLLSVGQLEPAVQQAEEAVRRATGFVDGATDAKVPTDIAVTLARAWYATFQRGRVDRREALAEIVKNVQLASPGEAETLCIHVALLAGDGRKAEAVAALSNALLNKRPISEVTLLRLASISRGSSLGLEDRCYSRLEKDHGATATLAFALANDLLAAGKPGDGLQVFEDARARARPVDPVEWDVHHARYLDLMRHRGAKAALIALADGQPTNLAAQRVALAGHATRTERAFLDRVIRRLGGLAGEESAEWRLAKSRWLLASSNVEPSPEAANILRELVLQHPDLLDARLLYGEALGRAGEIPAAIEQLTAAANLNPHSAAIRIALANLYASRNDSDKALQEINRIAVANVTPEERRQVAFFLIQQGEAPRALAMLKDGAQSPLNPSSEDDMLLASMYRDMNDGAGATATCERLLKANPDANTIAFVADVLASTGHAAAAQAALAKLDGMKLEPGFRALVLADFAGRHGGLEEALVHYEAAAKQAPGDARIWKGMIATRLRVGRPADVLEAVERARQHVPDNASIQDWYRRRETLAAVAAEPSLHVFSASLLNEGKGRAGADEIVAEIRKGESLERRVTRLEALSSKYMSPLPLQLYLAEAYSQLLMWDEAVAAAARAAKLSPAAADPLRIQANMLRRAGRWAELIGVVERWKTRAPRAAANADLAAAEAHVALDRPADAVAILTPYVDRAEAPTYGAVLALYASAQRTLGVQPAPILEPLLKKGREGRQQWMAFAVGVLPEDEAAAWLERFEQEVPATDPEEQVALSESWSRLAQRSGEPRFTTKSREVLEAAVSGAPTSEAARMALAIRDEQDGHIAEAEAGYRRVLQINQSHWVAQNNLAFLLVTSGRDLPEAETLARAAVLAQPQVPAVYDTLGQVLVARKQYPAAVEAMRTAVRLRPAHCAYHVKLGECLVEAGQTVEAKATLETLEALLSRQPEAAEKLEGRIASLRRKLLADADAVSATTATIAK